MHFTEIDIGEILRLIEVFIGRKGVNDEAKTCKSEWMKRIGTLQTQKILKTQKNIMIGEPKPF